jgi:hypothetical protein
MERLEILINKVRARTNVEDRNGVTDTEMIGYFKDAKDLIQSTIYQAGLEPELFVGTATLTVASGEVTCDLPTDIFAKNAIFYVSPSGSTRKLNKIQSYERGTKAGYFLENNEIGFSESLLTAHDSFVVKYFKKVPDPDIRRGKVTSKGAGEVDLDSPGSLGTLSDFVTFVDKNGEVQVAGLEFVSVGVSTLTLEGDITDVAVGDYVVNGKYASSHIDLPDECESFLLQYVEKRVMAKNASSETPVIVGFSEEQKAALIQLFSGKSSDLIYPPMTDSSWGEM